MIIQADLGGVLDKNKELRHVRLPLQAILQEQSNACNAAAEDKSVPQSDPGLPHASVGAEYMQRVAGHRKDEGIRSLGLASDA